MSSLGNNVMIEKHAEQVGWNTSDLAYTMICREAISLVLDHPTILLLVSESDGLEIAISNHNHLE